MLPTDTSSPAAATPLWTKPPTQPSSLDTYPPLPPSSACSTPPRTLPLAPTHAPRRACASSGGSADCVPLARLVGVLVALHGELAVVRQGLGEAAHGPRRAAQHAREPREPLRPQVLLDRRGLGREGREHE